MTTRPEQPDSPSPVRVALLGCGNVGGALAELLTTRQEDIAARTGIRLELVGIAVADTTRPRSASIPVELFGTDAGALVVRNDVDVVVELIGGTHPAHELIEAALRAGKPVVTGNKAVLAVVGGRVVRIGGLSRGRPLVRGRGGGCDPGRAIAT